MAKQKKKEKTISCSIRFIAIFFILCLLHRFSCCFHTAQYLTEHTLIFSISFMRWSYLKKKTKAKRKPKNICFISRYTILAIFNSFVFISFIFILSINLHKTGTFFINVLLLFLFLLENKTRIVCLVRIFMCINSLLRFHFLFLFWFYFASFASTTHSILKVIRAVFLISFEPHCLPDQKWLYMYVNCWNDVMRLKWIGFFLFLPHSFIRSDFFSAVFFFVWNDEIFVFVYVQKE